MSRSSQDGPEDVDAAFAEIVAALERDGHTLHWPEDGSESIELTDPDITSADEPTPPAGQPVVETAEDEEHYVPPEPPPLPTLRPSTIAALMLIITGVLLLVAPALFGLGSAVATPVALLLVSAGAAWLVFRMRQGPPPGEGWDDGAQV